MNRSTVWTLVAFAGALALVFGGGYLFGNRVPTVAVAEESAEHAEPDGGMADMEDGTTAADDHSEDSNGAMDAHGGHDAAAVGVALAQNGFLLHLMSNPTLSAGQSGIKFHILDADGAPVTEYVRKHEKDLHLILVSSDLSEFHHVHPTIDAGGEWSVPVDLQTPGSWRMYADFTPGGTDDGLVLSRLLTVTGDVAPQPLPEPGSKDTVDGYDVELAGHPDAGTATDLTFTVQRDGTPVTDLDPYLGADGHLVAIREGDLAYPHTHPGAPEPTGGPDITFATTFPTPGNYRVFLDFSHSGDVHTAAFTVAVEGHHR